MQIKLTIALVAAAFALASYPASAADMPADGTKNFTAPGDAPSYFTNETVPATARVANQATFTEVEEATAPEEPATDRGSKRASARKSTKHASGKSKGSGGSANYTKAPSSKATRSGVAHGTGGRSASAATGSGKSGAPAGAGKAKTTKQAKSGIRQQAAAVPRTTAASFA
jgi:hypothetical protein